MNFDKFRPGYHNGNKKITRSDRNYGHAAPNEQLEIGTRLRWKYDRNRSQVTNDGWRTNHRVIDVGRRIYLIQNIAGNAVGGFVIFRILIGEVVVTSLPQLKNRAGGIIIRICPSVSESVSLCVQKKNLRTPYLKSQRREFHPILVTDALGFTDVLIRFWGQKVKSQGNCRRKHNRRRQPVEFCLVFFNFSYCGVIRKNRPPLPSARLLCDYIT